MGGEAGAFPVADLPCLPLIRMGTFPTASVARVDWISRGGTVFVGGAGSEARRTLMLTHAITFFCISTHLPFSPCYPLVLDEVIDTTGILSFLFCLWFYFLGDLCTARRARMAGLSFLLGPRRRWGRLLFTYHFLPKVRDSVSPLDCTCSYIRNVILLEEKKIGELKSRQWSRGHYNNTVPTLWDEVLHP